MPHVDAHADRVLAQLHEVEDDAAFPAHVRAVAKLELQVLQSDSSMSVGMVCAIERTQPGQEISMETYKEKLPLFPVRRDRRRGRG